MPLIMPIKDLRNTTEISKIAHKEQEPIFITRACLKIAFWQLCVTICGRLDPNEGGEVGYVDRMRAKYTANVGTRLPRQMAGMNFQTRSKNGYSDLVVMSSELYDKFARMNRIDQAIFESEQEIADGAEAVDAERERNELKLERDSLKGFVKLTKKGNCKAG